MGQAQGVAWVVCPPLCWCCVQRSCAGPCFDSSTSEVAVGFWPFCSLLFIICPNCACMQLLSVPCSFFVGEGNGTPLQYSCLENPMNRGVWWAAVHGVATSRTRLNDFTFTFHFHALEKEMATHSSVLAWRILGTGEPGGLPSMGSHRVRHNCSDLAAAAAASLIVFKGEWIHVDA